MAVLVCFWGCLRSDNVVLKSAAGFDPLRHVCWSNLQQVPEGLVAVLHKTKTRSTKGPVLRILLSRLNAMFESCPVRAILQLTFQVQATLQGPLFLFFKGGKPIPLLYKDLRSVIGDWAQFNGLPRSKYGSHSARSGGATTAYHAGVGEIGIKKLGDWLSDTFLNYVRHNLADLSEIQLAMLSQMQFQTSN